MTDQIDQSDHGRDVSAYGAADAPAVSSRKPRLISNLAPMGRPIIINGWAFALIFCAFAAVLLLLNWQRVAMDRQVKTMRAQTDLMASQLANLQQSGQRGSELLSNVHHLAEAGRMSADAAQQSAIAADQALRLTQRAYLVASPPATIDLTSRPLRIQTRFINQGNTAAQDVSTTAGQAIFQDSNNMHIDFSKAARTPNESNHMPVPPHAEYTVGFNAHDGISADDLRQLTTGHATLVVYGSAAYNDAFATPHFAHFCKMFQFDTLGNQVRDQPCPEWNDAN